MLLFVATTLALVTLAQCGNYTVTQEAWFDVEVQDMDGPGQDYRGRFVIALFGETAPMTSMNFASITKGYKKGKVGRYYTTINVRAFFLGGIVLAIEIYVSLLVFFACQFGVQDPIARVRYC